MDSKDSETPSNLEHKSSAIDYEQLEIDFQNRYELEIDELEFLADRLELAERFRDSNAINKYIRIANKDASVKTIYNVYCKGSKKPPLKLNSTVGPSLEYHSLRGMAGQKAKFENLPRGDGSIWDQLDSIVIPRQMKTEESEVPRQIPSGFSPSDTIVYDNEIGIQINVEKLVRDVIVALGYDGDQLNPVMEIQMYGVTPDIIIVCQDNKIVFVIEVKSPDTTHDALNDEVMNSELVGGQIWLYLMIMRQQGVKNPLGAICTLDRVRIVSLDDMETHKFEEAMESLKTKITVPQTIGLPQRKNEAYSPLPKYQKAAEASNPYTPEEAQTLFAGQDFKEIEGGVKVFNNPSLYGSPVLEREDVFPALLLSLKTAMLETDLSGVEPFLSREVLSVSTGDNLGNRVYPWLTTNNTKFAFTRKSVNVNLQMPRSSTKNYHSICELGRGSDGQVYLVMSSSGKVASVKFYHRPRSYEADPEMRKKADELAEKKCEEKLATELTRWNELQHNFGARQVQLNDRLCLLMPYGMELLEEDREHCRGGIEEMFVEFAKKGYVYKDTDLLWRHILKDPCTNKLFFADLLSLEKSNDAKLGVRVKEQIDALFQRSKKPQQEAGSEATMGDSSIDEENSNSTSLGKRNAAEVPITDRHKSGKPKHD